MKLKQFQEPQALFLGGTLFRHIIWEFKKVPTVFINKTDSKIRIKEKFLNGYDISKKELENGFEYQIINLKPLKQESGYQGVRRLTPKLLVALNTFALKGVKGTAGDWNEYGKWIYDKLIEGRAELDEATKVKIKSMVSGIKSPLEKAKIVYDFVQNKTRYISVQVGIGGWNPLQPIE